MNDHTVRGISFIDVKDLYLQLKDQGRSVLASLKKPSLVYATKS